MDKETSVWEKSLSHIIENAMKAMLLVQDLGLEGSSIASLANTPWMRY